MDAEKIVKGIRVTAREWTSEDGSKHRIYFRCMNKGGAVGCWDIDNKAWIKQHKQFNAPFTGWVLEAFGL